MDMQKQTGIVTWFREQKGYGFICRDDGQGDVFVHHSGIVGRELRNSLKEGTRVSFFVVYSQKGMKAVNVTALEGL